MRVILFLLSFSIPLIGLSPTAHAFDRVEVYADTTLAGQFGYLATIGGFGLPANTYFVFEEMGHVRFSHIRFAGQNEWLPYPPYSYLTPPSVSDVNYSWSFVPDQNSGPKLATIEYFVRRNVPAGEFETASCAVRLVEPPFGMSEYFSISDGVGIVRYWDLEGLQVSVLRDFSIVGGSGFFPLAVGNWWEYEIEVVSAIEIQQASIIQLYPCFPNPSNPQTTIAFELPKRETVTLRIFDMSGRLVKSLITSEPHTPGRHEIVWNGRDDTGRQVASGTYFYRLDAGSFSETKRMVLIK